MIYVVWCVDEALKNRLPHYHPLTLAATAAALLRHSRYLGRHHRTGCLSETLIKTSFSGQ